MTYYLSGPMSGMPLHNKPAFDAAAATLRAAGHVVLNPHEIAPADPEMTWEAALRTDLLAILMLPDCQLVMLSGWKESRGARLEHHVASELRLPIYHYHEGQLHT
jgi:hypothetical protein